METYNDIYLRVRKTLKAAGIQASDMEAKYIISTCMGKSKEEMLANFKIYATDKDIVKKINQSLERRLTGEPLAYILGEWEFYGLTINVNKKVLIPRNDTELLAQEAIKITKRKVWKTRVLDLCAGTGCIGLAIAKNVPEAHIVMADNNPDAIALCRQNALKCGLSRNTTIIQADALAPPPPLFGIFDVIVSNPPYIPAADIDTLDGSVRDFEPHSALDGGQDGLEFYQAIAENWSKIIKPGGHIAFECGINQAAAVKYIMRNNGFEDINVFKDTAGIDRVITGKRNS